MPMFLFYKKGLKLDGIESGIDDGLRRVRRERDSDVPRRCGDAGWSAAGVFALPSLRGGGEFGEDVASRGHAGEEAERVRRFFRAPAEWLVGESLHDAAESWRLRGGATADC